MTIPSALIRKSGSKSIILQSEYNALVELAKASNYVSQGIGNEGSYDYQGEAPKHSIPVFCGEEIPLYSIFCVKPAATDNVKHPFCIEVEQANENNQQIYLTNSESLSGGEYNGTAFGCSAEFITGNKQYCLQLYTGGSKVLPRVGYPCGVKINTFEVDGASVGLICLAVDEPNGLVYCTLGSNGQRWLCKPISTITKNGGKGDVELFSGPAGAEVKISPQLKFNACNRTGADIVANLFSEMINVEGKIYVVPWQCVAEPPVTPATSVAGEEDRFDRTVGNNVNVGAPISWIPVGATLINDFMIVNRAGADHACQASGDDSGIVLDIDILTPQTITARIEFEPFGLKNGDEAGLIISHLDDQNFYTVKGTKNTDDVTIAIRHTDAGVVSVIASGTLSLPTGGTQLFMVALLNFETGLLYGYVRNENQIKSPILQAVYIPNGGRKVGWGNGKVNGSNDFDNFKVEEEHYV